MIMLFSKGDGEEAARRRELKRDRAAVHLRSRARDLLEDGHRHRLELAEQAQDEEKEEFMDSDDALDAEFERARLRAKSRPAVLAPLPQSELSRGRGRARARRLEQSGDHKPGIMQCSRHVFNVLISFVLLFLIRSNFTTSRRWQGQS